jgi:hypothetical protein
MLHGYALLFFRTLRDGLLPAILASLIAHSVLLTLEMRSLPPPLKSSGAGSRPLFLSSRQAFSLEKGLASPAQAPAQATKDVPKTSVLAETAEAPTPAPASQAQSLPAPAELKTDASGSVLPSLLSEPIFPGGSPNRGKWGQRSGPAANQGQQQSHRGPAFVVPFLQSMSAQLDPNASCDVKVSDAWTSALVSCTDRQFHSLIAGYLSQQLQMVNSLPDAGYCFQVKQGEFNTLSCN